MQYLGVITHPDKQSTSPAFQQAALDALGLDIKYERWPTPVDGIDTRVTGLRAPSVLGANVTIPHKETAMALVDELDDLAQRVGAVNTILNTEGRLSGYNTDVEGFLRSLEVEGGVTPRGRRVLIAGAGGAARAVVIALIEGGAEHVRIINRDQQRAVRLAGNLRLQESDTELDVLPDTPENWAKAAAEADTLVNCTSLGMAGGTEEQRSPIPARLIHPDMLVYDLVYRPSETPLLRDAKARGAKTIGGLPMLIYQGAASFKIWTGEDPPIDVMTAAAREALGLGESA